ncbi:hypothetical protein R9C00_06955 [Flammeovirgaceae bacterium SG7u.111]|nr:hypothetical protein [Flammeovirgaceae bacterium SG7u.132]WPO37182.1 hypothetical protein R9C00_06955 [Flammeovirgaceae bacterium SG7u.111]
MRQFLIITIIILTKFANVQAQTSKVEYKTITTVESIIPAGGGRSRMIESIDEVDVDNFTTERTDGKKSMQGNISRSDAKIDRFAETKMLNFYSLTGLNFQNIASNDAMISSKLSDMAEAGWELMFVTSGVESDAGEKDMYGVFITRFIFKRVIQL